MKQVPDPNETMEATVLGIEIERKFLVRNDGWLSDDLTKTEVRQGYLTEGLSPSVRVRCKGGKGFLTVKDDQSTLARFEAEFEIPYRDAAELLDRFCATATLSKIRYTVDAGDGLVWEVDKFQGRLCGLTVAEIELPYAEYPITMPLWLGAEVTNDPRYLNANLRRLDELAVRALLRNTESQISSN
jgi:adenylate cyclase